VQTRRRIATLILAGLLLLALLRAIVRSTPDDWLLVAAVAFCLALLPALEVRPPPRP